MTIRPQPEIVDRQGFRRRSWEFDYEGQTYYIQETDGPRVVFHRQPDATWQPLPPDVAQVIVAAFEAAPAKLD